MSQVSRNLRQTLTHWPYTGSDGYGGFTFGTPVTMKCRWEDRNELFTTFEGREEISNAVVYTASDVQVEDFIAQGDQTGTANPRDATGAYKVKRFDRVSSLRNLQTIRKAML